MFYYLSSYVDIPVSDMYIVYSIYIYIHLQSIIYGCIVYIYMYDHGCILYTVVDTLDVLDVMVNFDSQMHRSSESSSSHLLPCKFVSTSEGEIHMMERFTVQGRIHIKVTILTLRNVGSKRGY